MGSLPYPPYRQGDSNLFVGQKQRQILFGHKRTYRFVMPPVADKALNAIICLERE